MPTIYSYQKFIDQQRTIELKLPQLSDEPIGTELATIGEWTYVSIPDGYNLPEQPDEIALSVGEVELTPQLRVSILDASPHCRLINQRMIEKIRSAYTLDDEMYFARIGVGAANGLYEPTEDEMQEMTVFGQFVESVRQWGRDQRTALGL
ncbi:MAG TPA: hypothetical protein VNR18_13495 [Hyphomicrobiales bacterium]|nr:hypothetical protein [Hyphomicrobiales bacterium]